jgi:hypothetical protein
MQAKYPYHRSRRQRPGFLLLMVLICLGIVVLLYSIQWSHMPEETKSMLVRPPRQAGPDALPWEEESLLTSDTLQGYGLQPETKIYPEQPQITKTIKFKTKVYQDGRPRGELEFRIRPGGRIKGSWSANYKASAPDVQYRGLVELPIDFEGNVAPSKIYEDEQGQDLTKLYIISRGILMLEEHNLKNNRQRTIRGHIYVTGWLDTEYNALGRLTITSGGLAGEPVEWFQAFDWQASPLD